MKISEIITDKYKLRIPPTVYYDLLADVLEVEEATTKNDLGVEKIEVRKPCINYEDGCEEWAGCPCVYYKARK